MIQNCDPVSMLSTLAPTPPGVEACSCDEALALRRELAVERVRLARARALITDARQRAIEKAWAGDGEGDD